MRLPFAGIVRAGASVAVVLTVAFAPRPAQACSCIESEAAPSIASSDVVFEGTAIGAGEPVQLDLGFEGYLGALRFRFDVERYFKGQLGPSLPIFTIDQGSACGTSYAPGDVYLVYARYQEDGVLTDYLCSRTRLMTSAAEDLALLGSGLPPDLSLEAEDVSAAGAGVSGCALTSRAQAGSGMFGLIAAALAFMRCRGRS